MQKDELFQAALKFLQVLEAIGIEIVFAGIRQGLPDHALKVTKIEASHPYQKNDTLDVQALCPTRRLSRAPLDPFPAK
jgi:hypothetical protein